MSIRLTPRLLGPLACLLGLFLVLWSTSNVAQAHGPGQGLPYDEQEAQSIDRMLMCPVCVGTNIDQSQAQIAQQMQGVVREMLAQGANRDEILDFFVDRYGTDVLAAPPKSGVNLVAWLLPVVGVLAALAVVFAIIRSMASHRVSETATEPALEDELGPYLMAIDRELALSDDSNIRVSRDPAHSERPWISEDGQAPSDTSTSSVELPREDGPKRDG